MVVFFVRVYEVARAKLIYLARMHGHGYWYEYDMLWSTGAGLGNFWKSVGAGVGGGV